MVHANLPKVKPSIVGTGKKEVDNLSSAGIIINISSVAYLKSVETPDTDWCAILLKLTFKQLDGVLRMADLPFEVKPTVVQPAIPEKSQKWRKWLNQSKSSKPLGKEELLEFDVPFWFPNEEETVSTGLHTIRRTTEIKPNLSVPTPVGPATVSGVGTTNETSATNDTFIIRWGAREYNSDGLVRLRWFFENRGSEHYPSSHCLIILIGRDPKAGRTFRLNLSKSLKIKSRSPYFLPRGATSLEFQISGNYNPTEVDNMLRAYKGKTSEHNDITLAGLAHVGPSFL